MISFYSLLSPAKSRRIAPRPKLRSTTVAKCRSIGLKINDVILQYGKAEVGKVPPFSWVARSKLGAGHTPRIGYREEACFDKAAEEWTCVQFSGSARWLRTCLLRNASPSAQGMRHPDLLSR